MRRFPVLVAMVLLGGIGLGAPPASARTTSPALSPEPPVGAADCAYPVGGQLTGAFVLGSPNRPVHGARSAGVVEVRRTWDRKLLTRVTGAAVGISSPNARFGAARAVGDVTGDNCPDLVVGVPGASGGRGAVVIVPDFGSGLEPKSAVRLPTDALSLRRGDALGTSVAIVGSLVVAGAPGRDLPSARNAGALIAWAVKWPKKSRRSFRSQVPVMFVQGRGRMPGRAEAGDHFGAVLAQDSVLSEEGDEEPRLGRIKVGIPDEDIGRHRNAGAIASLTFRRTRPTLVAATMQSQGHGLPGTSQAYDRLGASVAVNLEYRVAFGVPGKDADGRRNSGAVIVGNEASRRPTYHLVTQQTHRGGGASERGDHFGAAVAAAPTLMGFEWFNAFVVGAPGEDVGGLRNAGSVSFVTMDPVRITLQRVSGQAAGDSLGASFEVTDEPIEDEDPVSAVLFGIPGRDRPGIRNAGAYVMPQSVTSNPTPFARGTTRKEQLGGAPGATGAFTLSW